FHYIYFPCLRLYKFVDIFLILDKTVCIFTHSEEVALFFNKFNIMSAWCSPADHFPVFITVYFIELRFCKEFLILNRVPAFVFTKVNIALLKQAFKNVLYSSFMFITCRTNKLIVRNIERFP